MQILTLPNEILHVILGYLSISDLASLARTCSWLYYAVSDYPHPDGAAVTLRGDNISYALRVLATCRQHIARLSFVGCDLQHECHGVWERFWEWLGPGLGELSFTNCEIGERPFLQVLNKCEQLTSLVIDDCNSLLMSGKLFEATAVTNHQNFQQNHHSKSNTIAAPPSAGGGCSTTLRRLSISNTRYLSDALFNRIMRHFTKIQHLSLTGCQISFHSAIYKRFYPTNRPEYAVAGSESILTFQNVLAYLSRNGHTLVSLDLGSTQIDDNSLITLARLPSFGLVSLGLSSCQQITRDGVASLCRYAKSLQSLDLTRTRVSDETISSLTEAGSPQCTSLKTLRMVDCPMLTDESLSELGRLAGLVTLDLSGCVNVTALGMSRALCEYPLRHLERLSLAKCKISEDIVICVATRMPQLRHLDLSDCGVGVTNTALQAVAANLRWLRTLNLSFCTAVSYTGLTGKLIAAAGSASKQNGHSALVDSNLNLSGESNGTGDMDRSMVPITDKLVKNAVSIRRMTGLRQLLLRGCHEITDEAVLHAIHYLELSELDLSACVRLTDTGLCALGHRNPSLESLCLNNCFNVTDDGVAEMVSWLPRLRHLHLQGCRRIGTATIVAIERSCPQLRSLTVTVPTPTLVSKDLERLESKLKSLHITKIAPLESANTILRKQSFLLFK